MKSHSSTAGTTRTTPTVWRTAAICTAANSTGKRKQRTRKGTLQNALWQGMEELRKMRADECFSPDAWVTTWDSHNPGVLALVRKRGEETLVGLFNFTEYPAGASLDALGGEYHTPEGTSVWLADVELQPYQALLVKKGIKDGFFEDTPGIFRAKERCRGVLSFSDAIAQTASSGCSSRVWVFPNKHFAKQNAQLYIQLPCLRTL